MTNQQRTDADRIDSTTRRGALAALGGAGLLAALGGSVNADVGGGPESNELSHLLSRFYEGPESELPQPGVEGRRYMVTDAGGQYQQWTILRDSGGSWEPVNAGFGSVHAEELNNVQWVTPGMTTAEINDVIDTVMQAGGGEVHFGQGVYEVEHDDRWETPGNYPGAVHVMDGVSLISHGATLVAQDDANSIINRDDPTSHDIEITGFELDGNRSTINDPANNHHHCGILLKSGTGGGGRIDNSIIRGNVAYEYHSSGYHLDALVDSMIDYNEVHNVGTFGFHNATIGSGDSQQGLTKCIVSRNNVRHCESEPGLDMSMAEACVVIGNTVESIPNGSGITVSGERNEVLGNTVRGCRSGIAASSVGLGGDDGRLNVVMGNTVEDMSANGIELSSDQSAAGWNIIRDITLSGIRTMGDNLTLGHNHLYNIVGDGGAHSGIRIDGPITNPTLLHNTIDNSELDDSGLAVNTSDDANVQNLVIKGGVIRGFSGFTAGISTEVDDIVVDGVSFQNFENGRSITARGDGWTIREVSIDDPSNDIRVTGDDASFWGVDPALIDMDGGSRPRWNGVIGGGPLGGVDLTSVSASSSGEQAFSDGSATDFPEKALATWDGSQWVRADGQATVSPA